MVEIGSGSGGTSTVVMAAIAGEPVLALPHSPQPSACTHARMHARTFACAHSCVLYSYERACSRIACIISAKTLQSRKLHGTAAFLPHGCCWGAAWQIHREAGGVLVQGVAQHVEFLYTDISAQLVGYGRKTFGAKYPFARFKVLVRHSPLVAAQASSHGAQSGFTPDQLAP